MFGLYPAGPRLGPRLRDRQVLQSRHSALLVDHAAFTAAIAHQPFGKHRGEVMAQFGHMLLMSATTPGANSLVVTPTVEMRTCSGRTVKGMQRSGRAWKFGA